MAKDRDDQETSLRQAWMTAYLTRVDKMPSVRELLSGPPTARQLAAQEAAAAEHHRELLHAARAGKM